MEIRITRSKVVEYGNGSGLWVEFDVNGHSGSFSQNIYDDENEIVYCVDASDVEVYSSWSTKPEATDVVTASEEFRESFEKCFGIRIPDSE